MADCECLAKCLFFNSKMSNMPSFADLLKDMYCRGDNTACARYLVFKALGRDRVPDDLYPKDVERSQQIVAGR
jgi:hypothetical protein